MLLLDPATSRLHYCILVLGATPNAAVMVVQPAEALDNGLGRVPVRGVTSWCMQGRCGWDRCWDAEYRSLADALVTSGLRDAGCEQSAAMPRSRGRACR